MTAILVLGVSTTAFAYAEKYTVYGNELHQIVELDTNAIISFKGDPNALRGFEIYNKSLAPNTTNCQSGYGNGEYSVCIFETKNMALGYHEWVDRTTNTWGKFYIYQAVEVDTESNTSEEVSQYAKDFKAQIEPRPVYETTTDGVINVEVFTIPFDVVITENGKVTIHNNDVIDHIVSHTGTTGTEKGGTFYKIIPNGDVRTIEFPITGSTVYPVGVYYFEDTVTGKTGKISIEKWGGSGKVIKDTTITGVTQGIVEQVGIQENVVVVLKKSEPIIQSNSTETADSVLDKTKNFKTQIEAKINAKIEPLRAEIVSLKEKLSNIENDRLILDGQKENLTKQFNLLKQNATISETKYLEESKINEDLRGKILTLESQAVDTIELEKYRKDAANWKAVALEQLRVMAEILGLL